MGLYLILGNVKGQVMFSSKHEIWKFADYADELNNWLPYAEDLIRKWSIQNSGAVEFENSFQIILAALLLKDDLLPASARKAVAELLLKTMDEAADKKYTLQSLCVIPPSPGRKNNRRETGIRLREVSSLIRDGKTATEAYKVVAEKFFKSPDTIRREYERIAKKADKRE